MGGRGATADRWVEAPQWHRVWVLAGMTWRAGKNAACLLGGGPQDTCTSTYMYTCTYTYTYTYSALWEYRQVYHRGIFPCVHVHVHVHIHILRYPQLHIPTPTPTSHTRGERSSG